MDSAPLRILTVTNMWRENGGWRGTFVNEQVDSIRALGHHVDVEVVAQSRGRKDYLLAIPRVRRRVLAGNYDVVHIHYGMTALAARFVGSVPRVVTYHGRDVHLWWQRWMTKAGIGNATRVYASRRIAVDNDDPAALVVECGIDPTLFSPADQTAARARLGITHDEPVVLFGGDPTNAEKGWDIFTLVVSELRSRGVALHELVLAEKGLPREGVVTKFNAADVMLFPSWINTEASPMVIKEALMTGLPIVATDVGDVPSMLAGVTPSAWVAFPQPWGTPAARAQLVTTLADHTEKILATRQRSNGRDFRERVDLEAKARAVVAIYRDAIGRSAARS